MLVELVGVSFTYMPGTMFEQFALKNIDLNIDNGEFVALLGPTGSGKSTLLQHLNGLLTPAKGKVLLNGQEIRAGARLHTVRKEVGLVFQFPEAQLFAETVAQDVAFGPKNIGLSGDKVDLSVREALRSVGLDYNQYADRSPFSLSGGEKRLVAIAGVIAMNPHLLILDEPLSGLDARGKTIVMRTISELNKNGMTIILVAHDMDEVAEHVDRVIVLNDGQVVLDGKPEYVLTQAEYLQEIGLEVPRTVELLIKLKKNGFNVIPESVGMRATVDAVLTAIRERRCR